MGFNLAFEGLIM